MPDVATAEHPIIFNGWSIRRILAGEKSQTRRIIEPQPPQDIPEGYYFDAYNGGPQWNFWTPDDRYANGERFEHDGSVSWTCPFGKPGSVLWVREAFRLPTYADDNSSSEYVSRCPEERPPIWWTEADDTAHNMPPNEAAYSPGRKRPSIHMPKELCRLRLRVEDVRVERVQNIGHEDAVAEGIPDPLRFDRMPEDVHEVDLTPSGSTAQQLAFKAVWEQIHGPGAFEQNRWVWVVSFNKISK